MRLRLSVQRHALPEVHVLWSTTSRNESCTVSQLLSQINEVFPLETTEWGLEDYTLEIQGYECLHFQEIGQILKDEDEVRSVLDIVFTSKMTNDSNNRVRPLLTTDLSQRRRNGRIQISSAGRHLVDGVPYGRPFLRVAPDRPELQIPPRKRRRLLRGEENTDKWTEPQLQITASAASKGLEDDEEDEDDDDEDFEDDEEALSEEESLDGFGDDDVLDWEDEGEDTEDSKGTRSRRHPPLEEIETRAIFEDDDSFRMGLKGNVSSPINSRGNRRSRRIDSSRPGANKSLKEIIEAANEDLISQKTTSTSEISGRTVRFIEGDVSDVVDQTVQNGEEDKENFAPSIEVEPGISLRSENSPIEDVSSSASSTSDESSISSSEGDDEDLVATRRLMQSQGSPAKLQDHVSTKSVSPSDSDFSSTSSSSSSETSSDSSSDDSDSAPSEITSRPQNIGAIDYKLTNGGPTSKVLNNGVALVPPGKGKTNTKARNQRRRKGKRLAHLIRIGELGAGACLQDLNHYELTQGSDDRTVQTDLNAKPSLKRKRDHEAQIKKEDIELQERRQELLNSIGAGGIDVDGGGGQPNASDTAINKEDSSSNEIGSSNSARSRTRLDLSASKRLLFGSLGMRTPKSKEEEQRLKDNITKLAKAQPSNSNPRVDAVGNFIRGNTAGLLNSSAKLSEGDWLQESDDDWRDKIVLRAEECCQEGVELSTPPFPFYQRWDPQQQNSGARMSSKGKRKKRNRSQNYGTDFYEDGMQFLDADQDLILNYDDAENGVDGRSMAELDPVDTLSDLPELPEDVLELMNLQEPEIQRGAIIAFKQMTIGPNYQPVILDYRTAKVDDVLSDGTLQLTLAKRDTLILDKKYDPETGERIFGKFEMPVDDEEEEENPGYLELSFGDLLEPKLIKGTEGDTIAPLEKESSPWDGIVDAAIPQSNGVQKTTSPDMSPAVKAGAEFGMGILTSSYSPKFEGLNGFESQPVR
jgi:hypothetical protein